MLVACLSFDSEPAKMSKSQPGVGVDRGGFEKKKRIVQE
jgi:hypothetical protein